MNKNNFPKVTVVIPCRNEEKFIGQCLDSLIEQDYPKEKLEIFVLNGMSTDKTRQIAEAYSKKYSFIKVFDNPNKTSPYALNIGLQHSTGELFMHLGAHAIYQKNHISKCVKYLKEYGADMAGGVALATPSKNTLTARAISLVLSDKLGGGGAFRRGGKEPQWADTAFAGCYKKELFEKVGNYNENLKRSQDMEMSLRIKKAGGKILLAPDIVVNYYPKSTFKEFFKHNIEDGIWAIYPLKFGAPIFGVRHLIPLVFILVLIVAAILGIFFKIFFWLLLALLIFYFVVVIIRSIKIAAKEKSILLAPFITIAFFVRHFAYGIGSFIGLIKLIL